MTKKYTKKQVNYVAKLVSRETKPMKVTPATKKMCEKFGIKYTETVGRAFRKKMQDLGITNNSVKIEDSKEFKKAASKVFDRRKKTFMITWAQSETDLHKRFFKGVEAYAKEHKAGLHVIAGRYRNPTSIRSSKNLQRDEDVNKHFNWAEEVQPYLDANRHNIHKYLQILSDVKVQPTAATPLSGFNGISGLESCIIGHPRVHLKSLPVLDAYPNKLLLTTGACTVENYTDTKAGKKGDFHHQLGFVIVELDGDYFHIRQVTADENGDFYDLNYHVKNGVVKKNKKGVEAIILGDIHNLSTDPVAMKVSEEMMELFKPNHTIVHDLFDGYHVNPHEKKDPFKVLAREESGGTLASEIQSMVDWLHKYKEYNLVVVRSNHDVFFDRFLTEDWRKQGEKLQYLRYAAILAEGDAPNGIIPYIIDREFDGEVRALGIDDSYNVLGWELGVHGHIGASGSRGSATQFKSLNVKNVTGHTHTPIRIDGHLSVGTLTKMKLGYNHGMSSWMHSNVVIYPNGKAQHLHIMNGKFTNFKFR